MKEVVCVVEVIVSGLMALACAIVGAKIATNASIESTRKQDLISAYADVFARFYERMAHDNDPEILLGLIIAIERACLVCSPKAEQILRSTIPIVSEDELDIDILAPLIKTLRAEARDDVDNASRKHHRTNNE